LFKRKPLYEQAKEELIQRIKDGVYLPSGRLPSEKVLSQEFQVSRSCIREAMKSLCLSGLVQTTSGKGSYIRLDAENIVKNNQLPIDFSDHNSIRELMELRKIIEPQAAALATEKASEEQISEMRQLIDELKQKANSGASWAITGFEIHSLISRMTCNHLLMHVLESISDKLQSSRDYLYRKESRDHQDFSQDLKEHEDIYQAIRARDVERAKEAMTLHVENASKRYLK